MLFADEQMLNSSLRQLGQFGYDLDRVEFVAADEAQLISELRTEYESFVQVVTQVVGLVRSGRGEEARELQRAESSPLADRLERLTNQLVNLAESGMVAAIDETAQTYRQSQLIVLAFVIGSILLALGLGYIISSSLILPVRSIEERLSKMAVGDFSEHINVVNRDELGKLAYGVNRTNDELGQLYRKLEQASRHKSEFLANTSHELRTPLNAIIGYTELIQDGIYGEVPLTIREVLERVQTNSHHLLGLINDVLDLSKIEAGKLTLSVNEYSMEDVVRSVVTATGALASEKKLAIRTDITGGLPVGKGDERRIAQVLLNLVGNAIKFTEEGEITVRARAVDGAFLVDVADTGPGIALEDQTRIFEEFQQVDTSSTREKGGTGLGLAIAKRIIELHGGRIWVESEQGKGAIFHLMMPVRVNGPEIAA
jgi:signal transduction histidine kinase